MTAPIGMILAAGFGTRLRPLTLERPKPLVPVGDRTILAHAAANLRVLGVSRLVINTHHLAEQYDADALREELGMEVRLNHESSIRGTAGGISAASEALGQGELLIHNGDIWADFDGDALLAAHRESQALATLALVGGGAPRVGPVGLGAQGEIVRLRQEVFGEEREGAAFIGVHVVSATLRERLPELGCMVGDVYIPALRAGEVIVGAKVVRSYTDVGTPRAYLEANRRWLARLNANWFRGANVSIDAGVEVSETVIGAGATVRGSGCVTRCVIWPGAHVTAPLSDAIVSTGGKVLQEMTPVQN